MAVDFNFFLNRKYAQLQEQSNIARMNAETNALTGAAAARLDNTRSALLPKESRATVAKMGAETNLIGEQAAIVAPESAARVRGMDADTKRTLTGEEVDRRQGLTSIGDVLGGEPVLRRLQSLLTGGGSGGGASASPMFRTSNITPASTRRGAAGGNPGRMTVEELDAQQPPWRY